MLCKDAVLRCMQNHLESLQGSNKLCQIAHRRLVGKLDVCIMVFEQVVVLVQKHLVANVFLASFELKGKFKFGLAVLCIFVYGTCRMNVLQQLSRQVSIGQ